MTNETKVTNFPVSAIKVDPACQARAEMNTETITEYAEVMKERGDDTFPAIVVFHDGKDHWLSDGFHRYEAAKKAGLVSVKSRVRQGTRRDAILNSVGANASHGLRRTNADKRRAVSIILADEQWCTWSNREIARRCGVDEGLVRKVKEEQDRPSSASADCPQITRKVERNGTPFEMKTGNIGKKDGLEELLSIAPDRGQEPNLGWVVARQTDTADESNANGINDEWEPTANRGDEGQLQALMSAWARASNEVRQEFLDSISVSPIPHAEAGTVLAEASRRDPEQSHEPVALAEEPVQGAELPAIEPQENALFEMWKNYKPNSQVTARQWVIDGCPSEYRDSYFTITERLEPFRAVALATTEPERDQFLELSSAMTV